MNFWYAIDHDEKPVVGKAMPLHSGFHSKYTPEFVGKKLTTQETQSYPEKLVNIPSIEWKIIVQNLQKPWFGLFLRAFWGLHPGRLTAGTYKSPMKTKENDLNQTSMIMFHVNVQGGINLNNTFWMRPRWSSKALRWCLCFTYAIRCYQLASFLWKEPAFF